MAESLTVKKSPEVIELKKGNELSKQILDVGKKQYKETQLTRKELRDVGTVTV